MITGKQRSELKRMAQKIRPTVMIGKEGLTETVVSSIDRYLDAHELIKVQLQEGAILDPKETANVVADKLNADFVQAIGRKFVLYRKATDPKKRRIELINKPHKHKKSRSKVDSMEVEDMVLMDWFLK